MNPRRDEIMTLPEIQGTCWPCSSQPCPPGEGGRAALLRAEVLLAPEQGQPVTSHCPCGLPQPPPQEGECRLWLCRAGCRSFCSFSSASLLPFHHMAQQLRCILILLGCKSAWPGFPCFK